VLAKGNYPERLKFLLIKPVYKNGDKSSPFNFRPISLLPAFSKIFEKVIQGVPGGMCQTSAECSLS